MVLDFSKFFAKISLATPQKTKSRLPRDSWSQKLYVHKEDKSRYATSRDPALIFPVFHFWSSISPDSFQFMMTQ